jgi:hypothetical protein
MTSLSPEVLSSAIFNVQVNPETTYSEVLCLEISAICYLEANGTRPPPSRYSAHSMADQLDDIDLCTGSATTHPIE